MRRAFFAIFLLIGGIGGCWWSVSRIPIAPDSPSWCGRWAAARLGRWRFSPWGCAFPDITDYSRSGATFRVAPKGAVFTVLSVSYCDEGVWAPTSRITGGFILFDGQGLTADDKIELRRLAVEHAVRMGHYGMTEAMAALLVAGDVELSAPLWRGWADDVIGCASVTSVVMGIWSGFAAMRRRGVGRDSCERCGYELKGLPEEVCCPECGFTATTAR
jgi:hypothetical protein